MPGGKNPYTRPANKPERAALKRQKARSRLRGELENERERLRDDLSVSDEDFRADATDIGKLLMDLRGSPEAIGDRMTADNARAKQARRRDRMYAMNKGGAVPNNRKGFSQLPEEVQMKMDPQEAMKYMEGGAVKPYKYGGKVKKYMGGGKVRGYKGGGGVCRGGGAAVSGTKFSGVK
jgi:hypothetical protein